MKKAREFQKNIYFCFIDYTKAFDCVHHHKVWKILKVMGIFIGRTDTEAPVLWLSDTKSRVIGKDPDIGKMESKRRRGCQRMRWLDSITDSIDMNLSKLREIVKDRKSWRDAVHRVTKSQT